MTTDFPTAPSAYGLNGPSATVTVEKSIHASHTEILTPPLNLELQTDIRCQIKSRFLHLIERILGSKLGHHLGYPPAPEAGFSMELGCDAQSNEFSLVLTYCCDKRNLLACGNHSLTSVPFVMNTVSSNTRMMERICHLAKAELLEAPPVTQFGNKAVIEARYCCMKFHIHPQYFSSAL